MNWSITITFLTDDDDVSFDCAIYETTDGMLHARTSKNGHPCVFKVFPLANILEITAVDISDI